MRVSWLLVLEITYVADVSSSEHGRRSVLLSLLPFTCWCTALEIKECLSCLRRTFSFPCLFCSVWFSKLKALHNHTSLGRKITCVPYFFPLLFPELHSIHCMRVSLSCCLFWKEACVLVHAEHVCCCWSLVHGGRCVSTIAKTGGNVHGKIFRMY
jgi:hypothetical protein